MKPPDSLPEVLTKRELEILSFLASGCTNGEIAAQIHLSLNSVKWYARQIYGKLGAADRREAVARARELGLLVPAAPAAGLERPSSFPSGTVTFLFTDIEGSTPLWEKMPGEMQASVAQHHALLRRAIEANDGNVFQIIGDAFQASFRLAQRALRAALDAQRALQSSRWGKTGTLKVRMGLHTGPVELDPSGNAPYAVGHTLNRVARVMSAGFGGQILLSQETKDLVERELPEGVILRDMGEHYLKGLRWPEHLYQVCAPGLPVDFPALPTAIVHPNNLPPDLTSFIGREDEIELLQKQFRDGTHRLITLTGAGGTGKTRLALQVCALVLDTFPDGIWLVELAPLSDPNLVMKTVAQVLGLQESPGVTTLDILSAYLKNRRLLLMLDNCEHVLDACGRLANHLLHACPHLTLFATSREALNIAGETSYRVPSLDAPDPDSISSMEELAQIESVRLFAERATAVLPGFRLSDETLPAVARLCHRLDGIPLAIELAAARVPVLSVEQIAARLDDRFRLLTGGSRTALPRQRTLRASIDWSYHLLAEPERLLMQRLSVFSGGWTLPAAESVCAGEGIKEEEVLDALAGLVAKSLVVADPQSVAETRYHMLETIRQYAQERLEDAGQGASIRDRHLAYSLALAEEYGPLLHTPRIYELLEQLDLELDNLRGALAWAQGRNDRTGAEQILRILTALFYYWLTRSLYFEMAGWMQRALDLLPDDDSQAASLKAWSFLILGVFEHTISFFKEAWDHLTRCITLCRQVADLPENRMWLALALAARKVASLVYFTNTSSEPTTQKESVEKDGEESLSLVQEFSVAGDPVSKWIVSCIYYFNAISEGLSGGESDKALQLLKIAHDICISNGDQAEELEIIWLLGRFYHEKDPEQSIHYGKQGILLAQRLGFNNEIANFYIDLGLSAYCANRFQEMEDDIRAAEDVIRFSNTLSGLWGEAQWITRLKGVAAVNQADASKAQSLLITALDVAVADADSNGVLSTLIHCAGLALLREQKQTAARLLGFVERQKEMDQVPDLVEWQKLPDRMEYEKHINRLHETLSAEDFAALWTEGRAMTMEQALHMARALADGA